MAEAVRVMVEHGKKKRVVACAFDWPGWDRSAKIDEDMAGQKAGLEYCSSTPGVLDAEMACLADDLCQLGQPVVTASPPV
jgi:hypothetical protein